MAEKPKLSDTKELRRFLLDRMHDAASGKIDAPRAKSIANFAQQIYNTLNVEIRMATLLSKSIGAKITPVKFDD